MTRLYYEQGQHWSGANEENWVIRWFLWHVFRYRDNRNRSGGTTSAVGSPTPGRNEENGYPGQGIHGGRLQSGMEEQPQSGEDMI